MIQKKGLSNRVLIKGLSNRKMGVTRINSKSSRSHIMFTCIIESWCKESSSKCFGSSKISRISLVDLAGHERNMLANSSKQHVKEGKYIKKSTSQLGRLVNILSEGSKLENSEEVPYKSSRLTHLLKESFGGNAKLSVLCTITPDNKNNSESISTLRFGLMTKLMKNEPVVNEIKEDDVNDLSDQIRQLKEELMRAKSSTWNSLSSGRNARESLNQLRLSLNRSLILPRIENDAEENFCINEDDFKELRHHIDKIHSSQEDMYSAEGCDTEATCENYLSCSEESENEEITSETQTEIQCPNHSIAIDPPSRNSPTVLEGPALSESPKFKNTQRKSLVLSSNHLPIQEEVEEKSSLRSSRIFAGPTESLAASLHKGLQIIDQHQRSNSAPARSSVSFSFEHLAIKPRLSADRANVTAHTSPETLPSDKPSSFVCIKCQGKDSSEAENSLKRSLVKVDDSTSLAAHGTKDMEKDLAIAIHREKELNTLCEDQAAQIEHLNKKLERCKCMVDKPDISCHSSSIVSEMNQLQPIKEDEPENFYPPNNLLTWNNIESQEPELIKEKCEIKEVQDLNDSMIKSFTLEDREALLREIEVLRHKLHFYTDGPIRRSSDKLRSSLLSQSIQLRKSSSFTNREEFEKERQRWMEMESEWISLTDELRIDIESNRQRAEKAEMELALEKKSTEELDDVVKRSVFNHARMIEHYTDLQEKYNDLVEQHRAMMEGIAEVKRAAAKAGAKGRHGTRFAKALSAELSALRVERERERELLRKENRSLKIQLKDTAEAVHAAGEVLVRLRDAEAAASLAEEKNTLIQEENEKLRKQVEKVKRKHKMEMITMKQYLAESRLPEAALRPSLFREDSDIPHYDDPLQDDDQAWRAEFGAIYQEHL